MAELGPRRTVKVRVSHEAWVQIPLGSTPGKPGGLLDQKVPRSKLGGPMAGP